MNLQYILSNLCDTFPFEEASGSKNSQSGGVIYYALLPLQPRVLLCRATAAARVRRRVLLVKLFFIIVSVKRSTFYTK